MSPEQRWMMVDVTDLAGHVEAEVRTIEMWDGGRVYRFVREDGTYEDYDGPLLLSLLDPRREIREQAA